MKFSCSTIHEMRAAYAETGFVPVRGDTLSRGANGVIYAGPVEALYAAATGWRPNKSTDLAEMWGPVNDWADETYGRRHVTFTAGWNGDGISDALSWFGETSSPDEQRAYYAGHHCAILMGARHEISKEKGTNAMSTELALYDRITDPMAAIKQLGHAIAASKLLGAESPAQGEVFALECLVRRTPPLMLAERYHVIYGKLSMRSDAMLAGFVQLGGKHRMKSRTPDKASIELAFDGECQTFTLTWEEARQEPFVYESGKGVKESEVIKLIAAGTPPPFKAKYATPRSRMQMLWARVVSDGVRAIAPEVVSGSCTPEEIGDVYESNGHVSAMPDDDPNIIDGEIIDPSTAPAVDDLPPAPKAGSSASTAGTTESAPAPATAPSQSKPCSLVQANRIKELWGLLGATPDQRKQMLARRQVERVRDLSEQEAAELTDKLEGRLPAVLQNGTLDASTTELSGRIRNRLKEVEQMNPGSVKKVTSKLEQSGMKTLDELRREDALSLLAAMDGTNLESFLGVSIWGPATKVEPAETGKN